MGIQINQYPLQATGVNNEDFYDVDQWNGTDYESKKISGATLKNIITGGLFAQTGNSIPITATTATQTLIDGGVGSLTVPANGFKVGDSFRVDMGGVMSAKNNDTLRIGLTSVAVDLSQSPLMVMPAITNQVWHMSVNFTVRAIGSAGTAELVTLAQFHILKLASGTQQGFAWNTVNNTTFDTTTMNTLGIVAKWSSNSALNSIYSDIFVLNKIY